MKIHEETNIENPGNLKKHPVFALLEFRNDSNNR
jgi:hypothetical protein